MHANPRSVRDPMSNEKAPSDLGGASGGRSFGNHPFRALELDNQRWLGDTSADSAETAAERAAQIEHSEMEARRRFDANDATGHR
jgi:hypothetical protein